MMKLLIFLISVFSLFNNKESSTSVDNDASIIDNLKYRNVGPVRGGRVTTVHGVSAETVSYTHLTLPTVFSV